MGTESKKQRRVQTMKTDSMVQEARVASEAKPDARDQLARYLQQQPQSVRTFDKVMKVLELGGLALVAGYLAWAIYVSINWSVPREIAATWFTFPICVVPLLILVGVHAAGLRAFPPVIVPGGPQGFVTGSKAVDMGLGLAVTILIVGAFWGAFAYGIWTENWAMLIPLVGVVAAVVGVGAIIALISDLRRRFFRSR
jgi:hypothetical protein